MAELGGIYVTDNDLAAAEEELAAAEAEFEKNFAQLDDAMNRVTTSGYTGNTSETLIKTYNESVKPKLTAMKSETQKAKDYLIDQRQKFKVLNSKLDNIMMEK